MIDLEAVPATEGILAAEDAWAGGVADFGDPEAAIIAQAMPGYFEYRGTLEDELRRQLGDQFPMYRAVSAEALEAWKNGADLPPMGFTFDRDLAESWHHFAPIALKDKRLIVIEVPVRPELVVLRGKQEESELVVDPNQISFGQVKVLRHGLGGRGESEEISFDAKGRVRWGRRAAGLLIQRGDGRVLLTLRSNEVLDPGVWGIPGGRVEKEETPESAAHQESIEELGSLPEIRVERSQVYRSGDFEYTTFLAHMSDKAAERWSPVLNWENDDWRWFKLDALPSKIHPNVKKAIQELLS